MNFIHAKESIQIISIYLTSRYKMSLTSPGPVPRGDCRACDCWLRAGLLALPLAGDPRLLPLPGRHPARLSRASPRRHDHSQVSALLDKLVG